MLRWKKQSIRQERITRASGLLLAGGARRRLPQGSGIRAASWRISRCLLEGLCLESWAERPTITTSSSKGHRWESPWCSGLDCICLGMTTPSNYCSTKAPFTLSPAQYKNCWLWPTQALLPCCYFLCSETTTKAWVINWITQHILTVASRSNRGARMLSGSIIHFLSTKISISPGSHGLN